MHVALIFVILCLNLKSPLKMLMLDPRGTQDSPPISRTGTPTPPYNQTPLAEALDEQQYLQDIYHLVHDITQLLKQETYQTFKPLINGSQDLLDNLKQRSHASFERLIKFAVTLNEDQYIYGFFGAPDGFVLAYSMLRYIPDLLDNASKSKTAEALRHCLESPVYFPLILTWLASLTVWSSYANGMSKQKDPDAKARYIYWQATRDGMKGLRNIHRGLRSLFDVMQLFTFVDAHQLLLPFGLLLGVPSAYNRWWNRHMVGIRKKTMDANNALSDELLTWGRFNDTLTRLPPNEDELKKNYANTYLLINKADEQNRKLHYINHEGKPENLNFTPDEIRTFLTKKSNLIFYEYPTNPKKNQTYPTVLQWHNLLPTQAERHLKAFTEHIEKKLDENTTTPNQEHKNRAACKRSAGYGGFVDGLYLFMPLVPLVQCSPVALTIVALLSTACIFAFILTRRQEEEEFEKLLQVSKLKAEFNLAIKQLEDNTVQLAQINEEIHNASLNGVSEAEAEAQTSKQRDANNAAEAARKKVLDCFKTLQETSAISDYEAIIIGLRHGLTVHGAIVCLIFAASLVSTHLLATQLPLAFILIFVAISGYITKCFIDTIRKHADDYRDNQKKTKVQHEAAVTRFLNTVKGSRSTDVLRNVEDHLILTQLSTPSRSIWPWLNRIELFRAFGSGLMKGLKSAEFITFLFATSDLSEKNDHEHSSYFIWQYFALVTCAIIWTFRGLAKFSDKFVDPDETTPPPYVYDGEDDNPTPTEQPSNEDNSNWTRPSSPSIKKYTWQTTAQLLGATPDVSERTNTTLPRTQGGTLTPTRHKQNTSSLFKSRSQPEINLDNHKVPDSGPNRYTFYTAGTSGTSERPASSLAIMSSNTNSTAPSGER